MSITGTGTQADPFVVTTYAELLEKAPLGSASAMVYVKLGNDINVLDEYPNGDVPSVTLAAYVDGDGKTIRNLYSETVSDTSGIYALTSGSFVNVKFRNIFTYQPVFSSSSAITSARRAAVQDCEFTGVCNPMFYKASGSCASFIRCSFNLSGSSVITASTYPPLMVNCFIRFSSPATKMFQFTNTSSTQKKMLDSSYIEADMSALKGITMNSDDTATKDDAVYIDNSVLDIKTEGVFTVGCSEGTREISILRASHAPDVTGTANIAAVDDTHWLDAAYLSGIGFNIEVEE
ncbi:MAG: hypothetical protein J6Y71_07535 [Ruminococcus sp.]|nr:hypothetical protein [Ruminococcus sp.]